MENETLKSVQPNPNDSSIQREQISSILSEIADMVIDHAKQVSREEFAQKLDEKTKTPDPEREALERFATRLDINPDNMIVHRAQVVTASRKTSTIKFDSSPDEPIEETTFSRLDLAAILDLSLNPTLCQSAALEDFDISYIDMARYHKLDSVAYVLGSGWYLPPDEAGKVWSPSNQETMIRAIAACQKAKGDEGFQEVIKLSNKFGIDPMEIKADVNSFYAEEDGEEKSIVWIKLNENPALEAADGFSTAISLSSLEKLNLGIGEQIDFNVLTYYTDIGWWSVSKNGDSYLNNLKYADGNKVDSLIDLMKVSILSKNSQFWKVAGAVLRFKQTGETSWEMNDRFVPILLQGICSTAKMNGVKVEDLMLTIGEVKGGHSVKTNSVSHGFQNREWFISKDGYVKTIDNPPEEF